MTGHRSRVAHFVIDLDDLDRFVQFWAAALDATWEPVSDQSRHIYRKRRLPDADIRILLQRTDDRKVAKDRMHLDLETDDVEAESAAYKPSPSAAITSTSAVSTSRSCASLGQRVLRPTARVRRAARRCLASPDA